MRRALRILIPVGLCALGGLAYGYKLNLLRVDLPSLLSPGDVDSVEAPTVASKPPSPQSIQPKVREAAVQPPKATEKPASEKPAELAGPAEPAQAPTSRDPLKIDFARVDAGGTSVIGGRAPAGSQVSVRANGEVVAKVTASDDGQWSAIVTRPLPAGPVGLSITSDDAGTTGKESPVVTVQVPKATERLEVASAPATPRPILPPPAAVQQSRAVNEFAAMVERARTNSTQGTVAKPEATIVPVPITFVTGEATMTAEGMRAAHLLAEYMRIMKPHTITLSGHADVRGTEEYNIDLSQQRLEAIRTFLRDNGYTGEFALLAKGKSEPYEGIDRKTASVQEIYQADRRVELRLAE